MNKKNKLFKLTVLSSLFAFSLTGCNTSSSANIITTENIDLTGVEFDNVSETVTYDGLPHSIFAKNVPEGVTVTYENNGAIEIGTHKIIAHFSKKTSGYSSNVRYLETTQIATLNIVKDATNVSETLSEKLKKITMDDMDVTYNGSPYTLLLTDPTLIPAGFKALYSNNVHTSAGTYSVTCKIVNVDTMISYRTLYAKMIINKAEIDIKDVKFESITYPSDGQIHTIEATNLPDNVSVRYELVNSNITDSLPANAITNVGYKEVKAVFSVDASSQLARSNYIIVNSNETDRTKNTMNARIEILAAGSVVYTIKYRVVQFEETFDPEQNKVTSRTRKYVLDSNGQPAIYSQTTLNTSYGSYISTSNLLARDGYSFEVTNNTYSDILTERGYLVPEGSQGGDIIIDYVPEIYTVNFGGENISLNSRDYTSTEERELINPKVADGYRFMGWYSDSGFNFPITSLRGLTGNRTIYGRAVDDSKLPSNFAVKDTFVTWDGTQKRVNVLGTVPSDVKARYYYYKIESDGSKTLVNGIDENNTPKDVGRYSVVVSFYVIKDGKVTDEKRYDDLNVYLVIEPASASSSSSMLESTTFTWTNDRYTGNYPTLTNYPQNATNITYEYFDTNKNSLGVGYDSRPTEPGKYLVKASYRIDNGTTEGEITELWAGFEITKKSCPVEFLNAIRALFPDYTYEINRGRGEVNLTTSNGITRQYSLADLADIGFVAGFSFDIGHDPNIGIGSQYPYVSSLGLPSDIVASVTYLGEYKYLFKFETFHDDDPSGPYCASLIVSFSNNKINVNDVGQITTTMYLEFVDPNSATYYYLPSSLSSQLTVFTSGESRVQFVTSSGKEISSISVATGSSVPSPTLKDYQKYLPTDTTEYNEYEYDVKWVSDNMFSSLSHVICDTKFVLTIVERKFNVKFVIEDSSKGIVDPLPTQTFTRSSITTFNQLSPSIERGYFLGQYYMLRPNGATFSVVGNSTFASVSRLYNTQVNNSSYCTDIVVYLRAQAAQTEATFDVNGGLSGNTSIKQTFGQPYNLPSDPTPPNGATFLGWMLNGVIVTKSSIYDDYTTGTLNFVAQYSSAQSTVTFLPENGDSYLTFAVNNNEVIPMPSTIPTKVGYIFRGWYLNNIKLEEGTIFTGGSSLVYIAQYDVIKINIIYHNNVIHSQVDEADDILVTKTADYGSIIPGPTTEEGSTLNPPTLRGYVFSGWSLDGNKLINSSNRITDVSQKLVDGVISYYIDLYPVYKNNNYKITYAFNVENILNSATDVIFNEIVNAEQAPTRIGYYFDGWYTTSTFDAGTNFFDEILKNPEAGINADCYPYERDIVLYAKWVRKEYKVTFRYIPDINNPNNYVDYPLNGMTIAYGQLLTSAGNIRTWLTEDEIYSTSAGQGLGLTRDVTPIFTYRNGSLISEGQAFLYDPASYEIDEALRNKAYDKENPDNNTAIIYINSTINNYFNVSYIADEYGLPTIQSVRGNSEFTLKNHPVREGKRWVAYYYYYVENNQTKKYYLTSDGTINGTPLNTWNLSNATTAKNGITDYVLYSEFAALTYRLFIRTNDQESLLGTMDWGGEKKEAFIVTEYGKPYNILSNDVATDFKAYINEILATKGYKFDYWRDNFGRIITANTLLTDPRAIDIVSSYAYSKPGQIDPAKTNYEAGIYLYAQVIPLTYNLTFFPDNNTNPYVINVGYNQSYTKMGDPVKDGYRFTGWKYFDAKTFDIEKYRTGTLDPDCALADGEMNDVRYNQTRDIIAVAQYEGDQYTITYKYSTLTLGSSSFTFNENDYSKSTVVENIKFSEAYTLKSLNDTDFANLNSDYKNYFVLYDFVGWLDEANQTIYPAGTTFKEYNRSTSSIYRAIYKPKQFTVEFLYQTVDNSSMSALTGTKKVTRIASREKVTFNDTISTPADPVPSSDIYGVGTKAWLSKNNETIAASGNYDLTLNFVLRYFYNNNYDDFNKAITDIVNNPTRVDYETNFKTLTFNLQSISTAGYYNIYLNNYNSNASVIRGSTYYNVYGNPESGDEKVLLEAGSKIRLPNINYTISMSENFVYVDPRSGSRTTSKASVLDSTNDGQGDPYTYKINGTTYKPFLRTVYVINGEYYLDGDLSPIDITGDYSNPTSLYAFTTYVSGSYVTNADGTKDYTELFNFTLKDENGEYIKSYVPSKKGAVVDDYTLDNKNEIAFAGFMNKSYTSVGTTYGADQTYRPVLIPYFYYDSETSIIRKVTYISHDQSGLGAFEESNYATQYFLPGSISYIASNTFKNAFTGSEIETVYVNYLDSSGYFDYSVVIMDSNLTGGSRLRSINANNFSYIGKDSTASYDSHRFFSGRLYNSRSYQTINTYTVLGFINSFVSQLEYAGSDGPSGKSGDYFYYSNSNPTRIPAYFKKLSSALSDASNDGISNEIIAFSQTDNGEGTGNIGFDSLSKKYQAYPFFLYYGSAEDFTKSYGTSSDVSALKLTDEADYPKSSDDGSALYPESPLYGIKNFYLTLPYADAKSNTVKKIDIDSLSELNAIYLDTPSMICNKIYNGTIDEKDYFGQGDPANTSADDNFVTTYLNYQSGTNKAKLTYFYNGDDEANGLTGTDYLIQQLRNGGDKADTIRNNFNSKCFEYDADGNVDNATLTRMLSTKNYKTKSAEYFYIGNYESFLRNGKEYVDQYKGQVISFLDLTDDELDNFDPENPLGIIDENTRLKKVYIGTSDSYLASLTSNNIKDRIDLNFMVYCLNSATDYNITPFFFGTLDKYRNLDRSDANIALDYPLKEGLLIQCLQTEDTSNLALLRDIIFAYFNDHDVAGTTKFVDYTTTIYQFNADGEFTTVENSPYYYNLTVTGSLKLIFQVKLDTTDTTKNIYYTSTADTFASSYFETFRQSTVAVLKYDYRTDQRYDGTTRTTLTSNDIELLFVGTKDDIGTGDNQIPWGTIRNLNTNYSITSQHVAYYLSAKTSSQIVYDVVNVAALSTNIEDTRTYLNYFFNTYDENNNRYKTLLTLAGNTYYYNENIKTLLAGVNTLNIKSDLLNLLTSNTLIYNALYCFKETNDDGSKNSIAVSNFLPMYYGTDQSLLESIKAERVSVSTRFIFVKPSNDYENTADIDDVLNDDMGLAFGVDSVDGVTLKQYVLSSAMPDLTANHYLNNKNRFISIITKTAEPPDDVSPAVYDIYYYFRGSSTDNEAKALTYLASDGSLKYENKFVLYEGTSTSVDDDFYNYIGSIDDILNDLSNPLFRSSNFYNLLIDTSVDETIVKDPTDPDDESKWTRSYTLKSKNNSLFFAGDASTVEENSTALEFESDNITPKNTQLIDLNNDGNSPFGDSLRLFADYITILLSDENNVIFYPVSYYRATELIETLPANTYFDYVFSGKLLGDTNNIANGYASPLFSDTVRNLQDNIAILNDTTDKNLRRNNYILIRGNNSINKGVLSYGGVFTSDQPWSNGQDFFNRVVDLTAGDKELNKAVPVYFESKTGDFAINDTVLLELYEGYDSIYISKDSNNNNYSSITYLGSVSKFKTSRKVNGSNLYDYISSRDFFTTNKGNQNNGYTYNTSSFNYAEINYEKDAEGNSKMSADSGNLKTMLFVSNDVILDKINETARNNNTSMKFYADLFNYDLGNVAPMLLSNAYTSKTARIVNINPIVTVVGSEYTTDKGKLYSQNIINQLYVGENQFITLDAVPDGDRAPQYQNYIYKSNNQVESILFKDDMNKHLFDSEEVIGITSTDQGLLDEATTDTAISIGSRRKVLAYYINKYIDAGPDSESPLSNVATVDDYNKIIKANYVGDGFNDKSIGEYFKTLPENGVMDLIPIVQFNKQIKVKIEENENPDDPDNPIIDYENQDVSVIAEILSMDNLLSNTSKISYLSAGWFGFANSKGLKMDGNQIANSWLSTINPALTDKIEESRVYMPRWVRRYTLQSKTLDDSTTETIVPEIDHNYDGRTYYSIDNDVDTATVKNETLPTDTTTIESYLTLDLVEKEETTKQDTIPNGYFVQSALPSSGALYNRLSAAYDNAKNNRTGEEYYALYLQSSDDLLADSEIFKMGTRWYLRHVPTMSFTILKSNGSFNTYEANIPYFFRFDAIEWINVTNNPSADKYYNSPYSMPSKILDVITFTTFSSNKIPTLQAFKKYAFNTGDFAKYNIGGNIKADSNSDNWYNNYSNNNLTPQDVTIYADDRESFFNNPFYEDHSSDTFNLRSAINPEVTGKTSFIDYLGYTYENTLDAYSDFALYKFYTYADTTSEYLTEAKLYQKEFNESATSGDPDFWDSNNREQFYSFYKQRLLLSVSFSAGNPTLYNCTYIDSFDINDFYAYDQKAQSLFNVYDSETKTYMLGDIAFYMPIVRLDWEKKS